MIERGPIFFDVRTMLPTDFLQRFQQICPPALLHDALASFNQRKQVSFRINRLRPNADTILLQLQQAGITPQPVAWAHQHGIAAYLCDPQQREALTHTSAAENGAIYIQSLSSMLAPILLHPQSNEWVLDLAAAPGGKTILLAELMQNRGKISAVEPVKSRFFRLKANLERLSVTNTQTYMKDGRAVGKLKPDSFDRVMLDAPCSSESRFKTYDAGSYAHWNLHKVSECAKKQRRLIISGFDALKPGGALLYCTCSYAPEENEQVVAQLLKKRSTAEVLPIQLPIANRSDGLVEWNRKTLPASCALTQRVWPTANMDGFYLALIRKR